MTHQSNSFDDTCLLCVPDTHFAFHSNYCTAFSHHLIEGANDAYPVEIAFQHSHSPDIKPMLDRSFVLRLRACMQISSCGEICIPVNMSCSCEYNISASAQVGKSAPQSAFDTVMAAFFRRKAAYSMIIKDLSTGARVQSFHELSIGQIVGHTVVTTRHFQYEEAKICYNSLRRMFRRERSVLDSTSRLYSHERSSRSLISGEWEC